MNILIKPASAICNMHCDYCFYCDVAENRKQYSHGFMSLETLQNLMKRIFQHAQAPVTIGFQGGEPTLIGLEFYKEVIKLVNKFNRNHLPVHYAMQTNGYDVTDEWCNFFKENKFLIGLSIDGLEETHNLYRHSKQGGDTYLQICGTAKKFDAFGVEYNILTVVNSATAKEIESIYRSYKSNNWRFLQFIPCLDPLEKKHGQERYSLSAEQYGDFLVKLFKLWFKDWRRNKQPYIRQFENYIAILMGYPPEACTQLGVCGIQNVVEADGGVYPCDFYVQDDYLLGNINENNFGEIDKERAASNFIVRSKAKNEKCLLCQYGKLCRNGCYRNREAEQLNRFCASYIKFFDACLPQMQEIVAFLKSRKEY